MKRADDWKQGTRFTSPFEGLVIGGLLCITLGLGAPACLLGAAWVLRMGQAWNVSLIVVVSMFVLCLVAACTVGELARQMYHIAGGAYQEIVGEVVKEDVDQIPKECVLVRGASEPAAPAETLLRAAQSNEAAAPDQLLRVVPGATGEQER